ncbi:glycosyltransferase [Neiella marina]|uniref:Glycosyltransferase n=1 Tax=Neiella holothuriorum TaxID=2870530 RepID=A0ABS7EJG8_9GAMM|nr:glycosyltransferase [Neiella holothuriorum]MBW8192481.1 glycosyltransferase [Neiella holothuriorum]
MSVFIQVVQHLKPGGIETMALDLCRMRERGEVAYVVSLEGTKKQALLDWPKLRPFADHLLFLDKQPGWQPSLIKRLMDLMRFFDVASVHTHHIGPLVYAGIAARLSGISSLIHTEHDAWHLQDKKRCRLQRLMLSVVRPQLVADARLVAKDMSRHLRVSTGDVQVIQNGINTERFCLGSKAIARAALQLPQTCALVGAAGRLEPEKGHSVLLQAVAELTPDVHLAIAGDGSLKTELQVLSEQLGINDRVHFLGNVEQMPQFYQALDLFCLPSFNEGLSLVLLEAQACGIPAVVTNVGASHEALCPGSGHLIEPGAPKQMAACLQQALAKPSAVNPRLFVTAEGDGKTMAKRYAGLRNSWVYAA